MRGKREAPKVTVFTVGHSTHAVEVFIRILRAHEIKLIADVRTIPKSRHNPQFNSDALGASLEAAGISYRHFHGLGGLRHPKKDTTNTAWRNASFRGFADYMQTDEFEAALDELIAVAEKHGTAVMCAEAVPWRCHRSLIGDALLARGVEVRDIMNEHEAKLHILTPWARVKGRKVTYPEESPGLPGI